LTKNNEEKNNSREVLKSDTARVSGNRTGGAPTRQGKNDIIHWNLD